MVANTARTHFQLGIKLESRRQYLLKLSLSMVIWRGKELVMLYNDAWRPLQGTKYPKALQQVRTFEQVRQIPAIALTDYAGEVNL